MSASLPPACTRYMSSGQTAQCSGRMSPADTEWAQSCTEDCQKWGARRPSEEIRWYRGRCLGAKIWQFSGRILHIPHKFFDCQGKYLPEHSEIIYPSINSINNFLGIGPKRMYYIEDTQKQDSFIFSLLIHGQVETATKKIIARG